MKNNYFYLALLAIIFSSLAASAQEQQFISLYPERTPLETKDLERMNSLYYDLQPTAFIFDSQIFGEEIPVKVEVQVQEIESLYQENIKFRSVELILVKITDRNHMSGKLETSKLSAFENLQYVVVECHIECSDLSVKKLVPTTGDYKVFYLVSIPR